MPSVTKTGTCLRPSCTAIVCPSMSGMIVERRDHVRITCLLPLSFWSSTFLSRWSSTNGPFFKLLGMPQSSALLVRTTTTDDHLVARLVPAGAALGLAVRVNRVPATGRLALATTVRVVDRVHGHATDGRALALPAHAAGLTPVDVALLGVADLADGGAAAHVDVADLAGGHAQLGVGAVLGDELHARAGRAGDLGPATRAQLDRVHHGADRDVAQRQRVARPDVGRRPVLDPVPPLQQPRREDVALLAVGVVQQRDARGAVGVVLDVRDRRRDAVLVGATEVDHAVGALVPAALVPRRDLARVVAAALVVQGADQ